MRGGDRETVNVTTISSDRERSRYLQALPSDAFGTVLDVALKKSTSSALQSLYK